MNRLICINTSEISTRVALVEKDRVAEIHIENAYYEQLQGNIYNGIVARVLPGLQAAFVDIGIKRHAFLFVNEIVSSLHIQKLFVDEDVDEDVDSSDSKVLPEISTSIEQLVQPGQQIMVQITREPFESKGARISTHITLPGRYVVLMPTVNNVGISKRIESVEERERLKSLAESIRPLGMGIIMRTAAQGRSEKECEEDFQRLLRIWDAIKAKAESSHGSCLLHQDLDPVSRILRDYVEEFVDKILIDSEREYERCYKYFSNYAPEIASRLELYDSPVPLFKRYQIDQTLEEVLRKTVWLPSGGYIVIEQTEALVAIDVNTGRFVGSRDLEDTVLRTNLEAAREIGYQIRLRNLGGIIIIDFIDMIRSDSHEQVLSVLKESFSGDRTGAQIYPFTPLGLVEITRKRQKKSLNRILLRSCPYCQGQGFIKHAKAIAYQMFNELESLLLEPGFRSIQVRIHPNIQPFVDLRFDSIYSMFAEKNRNITFIQDPSLHENHYTILKS
jgi:ribonuclease G